MGVTISINPNRADVELNLDYAEEQLRRAHKKAEAHFDGQPYLADTIKMALDIVADARRATEKARAEKEEEMERRWGKR